ncbi:MAG: DUF3179 domain-containing protein [Verrucomicrobiota bacterium]
MQQNNRTTCLSLMGLAGWMLAALLCSTQSSAAAASSDKEAEEINPKIILHLEVLLQSRKTAHEALDHIEQQWDVTDIPLLIEGMRFIRDPEIQQATFELLERKTGENFPREWSVWATWNWREEIPVSPHHAQFKEILYQPIDIRFTQYFTNQPAHTIRMDEIVWGGVQQDGIPPLRRPEMLTADKATYLADSDIVFGLVVNGDARAYPKRILAWHEMFVDTVGGVPVVGVYCTLCGSVILYETTVNGTPHAMGTSGFLYRSNKLMYDRGTHSLWSTLEGTPVVGPLVGKNIYLPRRTVVTTTWGEWKKRHPETQVLSLNTGHHRDYGEGVAYQSYFATDVLMFPVPQTDTRLANKAEVVALLLPDAKTATTKTHQPLAVSADYLRDQPIFHVTSNGVSFVILTDPSGANRVYARQENQKFKLGDTPEKLEDQNGLSWSVGEDQLTATDGTTLKRLPSHRAFWFGWFAAFPETQLIYRD